jgi:hypothetical protein
VKLSILLLLATLPIFGDSHFQIRRKTSADVPIGKAQCDLRLRIDGEAEITFRKDQVDVRTLSGQDARDNGSTCTAPLPSRDIRNFTFDVKEGRGEVRMVAEPSARNEFAAVVRIRDAVDGAGRYHFQLRWSQTDDLQSGFVRNNAVTHQGKGSGTATFNQDAGTPLGAVTIEIDLSGRILAAFRVNHGQPLMFTGTVVSHEQNRWKADTISAERSLRGPMYFTLDERGNVESVSMAATDGRDHLQLNWNRK